MTTRAEVDLETVSTVQRRYVKIYALAVIVAVGAIVGVYRVLNTPESLNKIITRPVVVALWDIPEGRAIERASVGIQQYPVTTVPAGAHMALDSVIGRVASINIYKGEIMISQKLASVGTAGISKDSSAPPR